MKGVTWGKLMRLPLVAVTVGVVIIVVAVLAYVTWRSVVGCGAGVDVVVMGGVGMFVVVRFRLVPIGVVSGIRE
jgi:hypothetical protein